MKRVCAWCGKYMGESPGGAPTAVTHGICRDCRNTFMLSSQKRALEESPEQDPAE